VGAGALSLAAACGGDPFVFVDASADSAAGLSTEAGSDGGDISPIAGPLQCSTGVTCQTSSAAIAKCCVGTTMAADCTMGACPCSEDVAQLECVNESNCPGVPCCIGLRTEPDCTGGHFVARCQLVCTEGTTRLCDPSGAQCPVGRGHCSVDSADLQAVALPVTGTIGVCKLSDGG
jgi:hypothetical protein